MPKCKHLPIDSGATPIGSAAAHPIENNFETSSTLHMIYDMDLALYFFDFGDGYAWSFYASLRLPYKLGGY